MSDNTYVYLSRTSVQSGVNFGCPTLAHVSNRPGLWAILVQDTKALMQIVK